MDKQEKLFKNICRLAGEAVVKYRMIAEGDRLLVGLSGGKDSFVLMHVLAHLQAVAPVRFSFSAATFDPGFSGFGIGDVSEYCQRFGWEHHTVSLNVPELLKEKNYTGTPCVLCSRLRRGKLYGLAGDLKCGKLALGQHLDDIIISFFMSSCRGQGLSTMAPRVKPENPEHPEIIRPLALVPEGLISEYASSLNLPPSGKCEYYDLLQSGDRVYFKELLAKLEEQIPDVRTNLLNSLRNVKSEHLL